MQLLASLHRRFNPRRLELLAAREQRQAEITAIHGSVELAPRLDAADAIVDLVSTGDTLRANGLRPIATIVESEAVLLARPDRAQTLAMCTAACPNGNPGKNCRQTCQTQATTCTGKCVTTCDTCAATAGCSDPAGCTAATQ